jgi:NADPH2:quinone reductase
MKAVVVTRPGPPSVLEIRDVLVPEPGSGEIRIRVQAFGVNRADLLQRRGLYPAPPGSPQDIPGLEHAGVVDAVGPDVDGLAPGDAVMGIVGGGAYAEFLVTPSGQVARIPEGMSYVDAAAIPEVFVTAHDALERLGVVKGEWLLLHAVGSGVGTAALQLAVERGARCIGTSRTGAKLARARELGMEAGVNTASGEFAEAVLNVTGRGANAVIDLLGGPFLSQTIGCMALRGRIILVGLSAGRRADIDLAAVLQRRLRIEGTVLRSREDREKAAAVRSFEESVLPLFAAGGITPIVDRVFAFGDVAAAHEYVESNASFGKVVVEFA